MSPACLVTLRLSLTGVWKNGIFAFLSLQGRAVEFMRQAARIERFGPTCDTVAANHKETLTVQGTCRKESALGDRTPELLQNCRELP